MSTYSTKSTIPDTLARTTLVLGGTRSGKSKFAEALFENKSCPVYMATAEALDVEMKFRIEAHKKARGSRWQTVEAPLELVSAILTYSKSGHPILVDCLSLWISNLLMADRVLDDEIALLLQSLPKLDSPVVFVSTEVGLGGIAMNELARRYADAIGMLHQALSAEVQRTYWVVAGISILIKSEKTNDY